MTTLIIYLSLIAIEVITSLLLIVLVVKVLLKWRKDFQRNTNENETEGQTEYQNDRGFQDCFSPYQDTIFIYW
jgi:hypothetical protein